MVALPELRKSEIDALLHARHPEPRSVLGYHEVARVDEQPLCYVRVLEPDAEQVEVVWADRDAPAPVVLSRVHEAGLFAGRVPWRRAPAGLCEACAGPRPRQAVARPPRHQPFERPIMAPPMLGFFSTTATR